jgi:hypothetical protein
MSEGPPPRAPGSIPGLSRIPAAPILGPVASSPLNQPGLGKIIKGNISNNASKRVSRPPSTFVLPFQPVQPVNGKFEFSSGKKGGKQKTRRYRKQRKQRKHVKKSRKQRK